MIKFFKKIIPAWLILLPYTAWGININYRTSTRTYRYGDGGGSSGGGSLWNLFSIVMNILSQVVILLIALAVVFFLYGILKYITAGEDEERRNKMRNLMIYGIIGLFVMISFWGIVNILVNTFELNTSPYVSVPYFDSIGTSGSGDESWKDRVDKDLEDFYGGSEGK